jgi:hypothetical protein
MYLFIAYQYPDDMNEPFVLAALQECLRFLPKDFFELDDYTCCCDPMHAYLML